MFGMNNMGQFGGIYGYPPPSFPNGQQSGFINNGMSQPSQTQNGFNAAQNGQELVPVQTIEQIEQVQVQPGQRRIVMVQNEPVIAARSADNMGLVTTEYYKLEKFDPNTAIQAGPTPNYITEEQLENRLAAFAESLKPSPVKNKKEAAE